MPSHNPAREDLEFLAGDPPLPAEIDELSGGAPGRSQVVPTGRAFVRYQSKWAVQPFVLEIDVYALPGAPVRAHFLCPKCRKALQVDATQKHILWEPPARGLEAGGGTISISPFQCTWELTDQVELGGELCRWKAGIDKNVARDA